MNLKSFLEDAFVKGENLKDELASELLNSKVLKEFLNSDIFAKAITTAIKTKDELTRVIRHNVKSAMQVMDIPSRQDLSSIERKLDQLEKVVDRVGKKTITVKSLSSIKKKKASRSKSK